MKRNGMTSIPLLKKLWHRMWNARYTVTQHMVHCPEHECEATVVVQTKARARRGRQHVAVKACSLFPQEPVYPPNKIDWVPDVPYYAVQRYPAGHTPVYDLHVPCHKSCLYALNNAVETGKTPCACCK